MNNVAGVIFSNIHDKSIPELTKNRTMASIPFGGHYRLVDFPISNMVNAGINDISVIVHHNYHSLMEHIGSGKDWDLARHSGGIRILPPYITSYANFSNELYTSRLDALKSIYASLADIRQEYVVLCDCDVVCNINIKKIVEYHIERNADITMAVKSVELSSLDSADREGISSNQEGRICDIFRITGDGAQCGKVCDVNLNIWVANKKYLVERVDDAISHGYQSFSEDIIMKNMKSDKFFIYRYANSFMNVSSLREYYRCSMEFLNSKSIRDEIFCNENAPIYTKVESRPPAKYGKESFVRHSIVGDGCIIEGRVENSIVFGGARISKGAVVKDSIVFRNTYIGQNSSVCCAIADKNVSIRDNINISGHASVPIYIEQNTVV